MGRIAFFILLALVVYLAVRFWRRETPRSRDGGRGSEAMLRCEHCGVYLPRSEVIQEQGRSYCSVEHQRAAQQ